MSTARARPTTLRVMRLRILFGCLAVGCANPTQPDPDATNILFIGNSATYFWDTPELVGRLLGMSGLAVRVGQSTFGGATLSDHAFRLPTPKKIAEKEWDYVILQPASYDIAFPEQHDLFLEPIRTLAQFIESSSPDAITILTIVWPWKDGVTMYGQHYSYVEYQTMLRDGTIALADEFGFTVAPVGWAWNQVMLERPDINMFESDEVHPSRSGAYLQACVYAVTILRQPLDVSFYGELEPLEAEYFQQVASSIVLDSIDLWNNGDLFRSDWTAGSIPPPLQGFRGFE